MTALVLVLSFPSSFRVEVGSLPAYLYFDSLIISLTVASSSSLFASMLVALVAIFEGRLGGSVTFFGADVSVLNLVGAFCVIVSLADLKVVLPLILLPYTFVGTIIVTSYELLLLALARYSPNPVAAVERYNRSKTGNDWIITVKSSGKTFTCSVYADKTRLGIADASATYDLAIGEGVGNLCAKFSMPWNENRRNPKITVSDGERVLKRVCRFRKSRRYEKPKALC